MSSLICTFWGVGQGLFSSGVISRNNKDFIWVYDCGSDNQALVDKAINRMKSHYKKEEINLLVISHFDKDHISGIKTLCQHYKIKRIVLPYYTLWDRLYLFSILKIDKEDEFFNFFINPVGYLIKELELTEETDILLVPTSDIEAESLVQDPTFIEDDDGLRFIEIKPLSKEFDDTNHKVRWLAPQKLLEIEKEAEFFFYNVPTSLLKQKPANFSLFRRDIQNIISISPLDINAIKKVYRKYFIRKNKHGKNNSLDANIISLFLYITPLFDKSAYCEYLLETKKMGNIYRLVVCDKDFRHRKGILYTGDGSLKTKVLLDTFKQHIGQDRLKNIGCLQVMHHGAKGNWQKGLGQLFEPAVSIFSADENSKYHHPHPEVVKDFLPYQPVWVNQNLDVTIYIC